MRAPKTGTFRAAWRHRRWRALLAGYTVSSIGDFIYFVAIVVYLIDETGSAGWVAASFIARLAAATACGPVGGVLADRFDRRRLMVGLDLARAVGMVGVTVIAVGGGPPVVALVLVTVTTGLGVAYRPAAVTATPQLVTEDDLAAANAAEATVYQLAWFIGPAIGGAIIAVADTSLAFGINAATFVISALLTLGVGDIGRGSPERTDERPPSMLTSIVEGAAAIRDEPGLAPLMVLTVAVYFSFGIEQVVQVLVVSDRLGWGASGIGALNAGLGIGGLLAAPFSGRLAASPRAGRLLALAAIGMGSTFALLAVTTRPAVAIGLSVVEGGANVAFDVLFITLLQRTCPDALLGRVYSLQDGGAALTQLCASIVAPIVVAVVSLQAAIVLGGGSLVIMGVVLVAPLMAISARTEAERRRLAPIVARLGSLGILGDAGPVALERMAHQVRTVELGAGTTVFAEGNQPDDLYVVTTGEVVVASVAEGEIRRLGPDEWFGEIGLLRRMPRTATVIAFTDVRLLVLPGAVFVDALTDYERLPDALARTMGQRLARTHPDLVEPP